MKAIKEFENSLGKAEVYYYEDEDLYGVKMKIENVIIHYESYKYRSQAIEDFQFQCYVLESNVKNIEKVR